MKIYVCKHCKKEFCFDIPQKMTSHVMFCLDNDKSEILRKKRSESARIYWTGRHHTEETRNKLSLHRIKYLMEHPEKVPYKLNHCSKMSYPEKIFKNALEYSNIEGWIYNYQHSIYCYDFAFIDLKIDVEIDGSTHNLPKVKLIDERRDKFSIENGWKVIRFEAQDVKENVLKCINELKILMGL